MQGLWLGGLVMDTVSAGSNMSYVVVAFFCGLIVLLVFITRIGYIAVCHTPLTLYMEEAPSPWLKCIVSYL